MRYQYDVFLESKGIVTEENKEVIKSYMKELFRLIASQINKTEQKYD